MITIYDIFDKELFEEMREKRYVNVQTHPTAPLSIANYSSNAQFDRVWNDVTMNCRGLIYNSETGEVISRGFKKFFNWDDSSQPYPPSGPCIRSPKMDGSLGILYLDSDGRYSIATRGSFTSDQAQWATNWLSTSAFIEQAQKITPWRNDRSYLFEIIFPENRIVVNYGDDERLVLLDVLDTATGKSDIEEFDSVIYLDKVEKINMGGFTDTMASDIPQGEEGFVLYWPQKDFRTKMKSAEYIELHRMIFGLNERHIWERLGNGETAQQIAEPLPDEFYPWVEQVAEKLQRQFQQVNSQAYWDFDKVTSAIGRYAHQSSRAEFAREAKKYSTSNYIFMILDGKSVREAIWKTLRPKGGKGISLQSEDVA